MDLIKKVMKANCIYEYEIDDAMSILAPLLFAVVATVIIVFRNNPFVIIPVAFFSPFIILGGAEIIATIVFAIKNWKELEYIACVEHPILGSFND